MPPGGCFGMSENDQVDRVWDIIEAVGVGMLTTQFREGLRARPLEPRPDRAAGIIWFLTDARGAKDDEVAAAPDVGLVMIDADDSAYLSITGRAQVVRDIAIARRFWKETDAMWWTGPDDPNLCLLKLEPITAELWDGPASSAIAAFEFVKARLTGDEPNLGENRKVTVKM